MKWIVKMRFYYGSKPLSTVDRFGLTGELWGYLKELSGYNEFKLRGWS
jgi:hypothetical protein